jgi:hypothetical protein
LIQHNEPTEILAAAAADDDDDVVVLHWSVSEWNYLMPHSYYNAVV